MKWPLVEMLRDQELENVEVLIIFSFINLITQQRRIESQNSSKTLTLEIPPLHYGESSTGKSVVNLEKQSAEYKHYTATPYY